MIEAISVGITFALVLACVAIACLAYKLPHLWQSRDLRTDQYLTEKARADALGVRLLAATTERDDLRRTLEQRDQEVARLSAGLSKEKRNALKSASDDDLLSRANGLPDEN